MTRKRRKKINIVIASPESGRVYKLKAVPIETDAITLQAKVFQDGLDITQSVRISWRSRLSYKATHKTYQTISEAVGNPAKVKFQTGGILRIRAAVVVDDVEYSARVKVNIVGTNPERSQINKTLDSDFLKAVAWQESTWRQFDDNGQPLIPIVPKNQKKPSMRGLFQISEWWWAEERTPLPLKDFNRMAWQWDYNIQTAKLILEYYRSRAAKNFPKELPQKQQDWALKAYKAGPSVFNSDEDPGKFWYVVNINGFMRNKPWLKYF